MKTYKFNNELLYLKEVEFGVVKIVSSNEEILLYNHIYDIIDENCKINGSSIKGRLDSSAYLLNISYKCPIIIREHDPIILFPTKSPKRKDCIWINYKKIRYIEKTNDKNTKIYFNNSKFLTVNSSKKIIQNQIYKSVYLYSILKSKL